MPFLEELENGGRKKKDRSRITLSDDEKSVLKELQLLTWPKGSSQFLPAAVRTSMRSYNRFLKTFKRILNKSKRDFPNGTFKSHGHMEYNDLHQFIQKKLATSFLPAESYISCWFEQFYKKVNHWKGWSGIIRPFSIESKEFQNEGYDLATEWAGNSGIKFWEQFMLLVEENKDESKED